MVRPGFRLLSLYTFTLVCISVGTARAQAAALPSCVAPDNVERSSLLGSEDRLSWSVRDFPDSAEAWYQLACIRAALDLAGGMGREGPAMLAGDAWNFGAINAAIRAIRLDPKSHAAELLGWLALHERVEDLGSDVLAALRQAVEAGTTSPAALRGCAQLALERDDVGLARRCLRLGLAAGKDSTFHLIRLARIAYRDGDSTSGLDAFLHAASSVRTAADREDLGWHLQWFVSPEELTSWTSLPDSAAGPWVRDRLASRDIRDGRAPGTRLQVHFARLEHVMSHFRLRLPREAWKAGGLVGVTPETGGAEEPDAVRQACEPGSVPARPYRFYSRWQNSIDDRGVIWMRFGAPDERIALSPQCPIGPPTPNLREAWVYRIDGNQMLLQFENERFDGSSEATRLVTGVLGSYLCGLDATRCQMTLRAQMAGNPLPPEQLQQVITNDTEMVGIGTTKDDNSIRRVKPLRVVAELRRLWEPRSGLPISLVTWAVRLDDLASVSERGTRRAEIALAIRRWSTASNAWHDTSLVRNLSLPDTASGRRYLTGALVLPGGEETTAWSVVISQPDARAGRAWEDGMSARGSDALVISDLVLGSARQGLKWDAGGEMIPLAPLGTIARSAPATLFYQLSSDRAIPGTTTRLSIFRIEGTEDREKPVLEVSFQVPITAGIRPVIREIDFSRLSEGRHRFVVEVVGADGRVLVSRSAPLLLD